MHNQFKMASARHMNPPPAMIAKPRFQKSKIPNNPSTHINQRNKYENAFKSVATGSLAGGVAFGMGIK